MSDALDFDGLTWAFCGLPYEGIVPMLRAVLTPTSLRITVCLPSKFRVGADNYVECELYAGNMRRARDCAG